MLSPEKRYRAAYSPPYPFFGLLSTHLKMPILLRLSLSKTDPIGVLAKIGIRGKYPADTHFLDFSGA
jgi:hypothetical protein